MQASALLLKSSQRNLRLEEKKKRKKRNPLTTALPLHNHMRECEEPKVNGEATGSRDKEGGGFEVLGVNSPEQ